MRKFGKAAIMALAVELVYGGLFFLGERHYLARLHLDFLAVGAMLLHLPGLLVAYGGWADGLRIHPAVFFCIAVSVQWLIWTVVIYAFLRIQDRCSRKTAP